MSLTDLVLVLILPAAVLASGACAAAETAVFSLSHSDRTRLRRLSSGADRAIGALVGRPRAFLLSVLFLTSTANVAYFVVGAVLERRFVHHTLGIALNAALVLLLVVGADLLPKLLARANRLVFCRVAARPLIAVRDAVSPVTGVLELLLIGPIIRLLRPGHTQRERALTAEELGALLDLSARTGALAADEQRLLGEVVELGVTRIREVMTPRVAMAWLEENAPPAKVREIARASTHQRFPVFRGSLDGKLLGMLDLHRYLPAAEGEGGRGSAPRLSEYLTPALCVPERARLDQLLAQLSAGTNEVAICVDEFGAVVGIVGVGDVVGRLLARGAETATAEEQGIERLGDDLWVVPGRLPARELAEYFLEEEGREQPSSAASTVGGLFFARLGRVPRVGDAVRLGNVRLVVEAMSGRTVDRVRVSVTGEDRP